MAEQEQKEINRKKEYLKGYEKAVRQMERAELKMQEIRLSRIIPHPANDGMPHAQNNSDFSSYAVLVDKAEKEYMKRKYQRAKKCEEITDKIEQLADEDEKDVLMYRYVKLMKWFDIQEKMAFSLKWVHKVHNRALDHLKI